MDATGEPAETYQPVDPMTVATQSTSLTQAVRLRYVDPGSMPPPIDYKASPVVPGRAGPADPAGMAGAVGVSDAAGGATGAASASPGPDE